MNDASSIFASLDRFIQRFADQAEWTGDHQAATKKGPTVMTNSLKNNAGDHSGRSGHPKQETITLADREQSNSLTVNSGGGLARKVLYGGGHNGQSGKSILNQELAGDHYKNDGGQSGNSNSNQELASQIDGADAFGSDLAWWRDHYKERSRHRQLGGRRSRGEAQLLAWHELQWRWHKQNGERVPRDICAGCRKPIATTEAISLLDGSRVHSGEGYECLTAYGRLWRAAAAAGLRAFGLDPPAGFEGLMDTAGRQHIRDELLI
jgi:hypothetical protein